ncbi:MAG: hypothetical protein Q9N68_02220 [Gammaproteobacteria bacterium]|nr:hypothetical protein [Gammaproteobacteria bacterium]
MKQQRREYQALFKRKFHHVSGEMEELRRKVTETQGVIFRSHRYDSEELLSSRQYQKIRAITEKVGDDVKHWHQNGNFSQEGLDVFQIKRKRVYHELQQLEARLLKRPETWWEQSRPALINGSDKIANCIPKPLRNLFPKRSLQKLLINVRSTAKRFSEKTNKESS